MRATILNAPYDISLQEVPDPVIQEPTDAIVKVVAACVCGSDLWNYRGVNALPEPMRIGHEYIGVVSEVGADVKSVAVGDFVIGPFFYSDNTCPNCQAGFTSVCMNVGGYDGCQAEYVRVPFADGTLVATPESPEAERIPDLLALSDVMATGWHAAVSAGVAPGMTVAVVGDGAVGLSGVLAAAELGAARVIAMSRHEPRQRLATEFGATDIVPERGEDGVARIKDLTDGVRADVTLECVGTNDSIRQAIACTRAGGRVGFVGVPHGVEVPMGEMFSRNVGLVGGVAPVRHYLPGLLQRVWARKMSPGKVFDLTLPLSEVAEAYRAMDERRAIKVLLQP